MPNTCGTSLRPRQLRERYCALVDANVVQRRLPQEREDEGFICYQRSRCNHAGECRAREPEAVDGGCGANSSR